MKRLGSLLLAMCLLLGLCACGQKEVATWEEQYNLGMRYLSENNYEQAIIAFTAAIEIDPKQADAFMGRAKAYLGSGSEENLLLALKDFETAVSLDSNNPEAYLGLGSVQLLLDQAQQAQESYQKAISLGSKNPEAYTGLADAYLGLNQPENAFGALEEGKQTLGDDPAILEKMESLDPSGVGGSQEGSTPGEGAGDGTGTDAGSGGTPAALDLPLLEFDAVNYWNEYHLEGAAPDVVAQCVLEFMVNAPANVAGLACVGYSPAFNDATIQKILSSDWQSGAYIEMKPPVPFYNRVYISVTQDMVGSPLDCLNVGVDADQNPVAYGVLTVNITA